MTAKDLPDRVLVDIDEAGATAAWNIANFVFDGCGLSHVGADLQTFGNLGDGAGHMDASSFCPVSSGRPSNAGIATTQSRRLPKANADQINKEGRQTDPQTNKHAKIAKWTVSEAAAPRVSGKKLKRVSKSDVFDGGRRDVDERTRRDLDESDDD